MVDEFGFCLANKINITLNMSNNTKEQMGEAARIHILRNFSKKILLKKKRRLLLSLQR